MEIQIPYGSNILEGVLPEEARTLTINEPELRLTPEYFKETLHNHLRKNTLNLTDTVVVVADKTRVCGYPTYLPLLVEVLEESGIEKECLRFIIAYGTHPRQSDGECLQCYGSTYNHYPFMHHNCRDINLFIDCGSTSRGTPIRHRRDILDASCVITMGPICHHYFAGYGGGRKLIFPGCGERESIYVNHSLYLDNQTRSLSTHCQPGVLPGNPIAEDLFEIEEKKPADLAIHGITNSHGQLSDIVVGAGKKSFVKACSIHGDLCESSSATFPVVIASCGGFPKDINFIQSHKAIHNATMFVEDGGTLIMYCELRDGIGSKTFLPWFERDNFEKAFDHLSSGYEGNGGTALAMMTKNIRIRIILVTELEENLCNVIGVQKWSHSQACTFVETTSSPIGYIPNASLLVKKSL
jgi:nickel-dependent lactate racemase